MCSNKGLYRSDKIEKKWQQFWEKSKIFKAQDCDDSKKKYYVLDMFPYPSGHGLHVGHPEGYTASDIVARYKRMKGFNVLHPFGWDAFGLPAEQHAIKTGTNPKDTTQKNIDNMRRQTKSLGFSYDWQREIATIDPKYYKWTQWIFLKLFNSYFDETEQKAKPIEQLPIPEGLNEQDRQRFVDENRLAYEAEVAVNWCPELGTVLANEEVVGGLSERGEHPVIRKPMRQWMLRITKYAERLLDDLTEVDWSGSIKKLQKDWIGKSIGADVDFKVDSFDESIRVFTTRPDTLFGATYMVMAPEHPLVDKIVTEERKDAVQKYREEAARKSDLDRTDLAKEKTGEPIGAYAINPVNSEKIPIWISDYVLISYGTGAIMAVPAHDERDFEFATKFNLPIVEVVAQNIEQAYIYNHVDEYAEDKSVGNGAVWGYTGFLIVLKDTIPKDGWSDFISQHQYKRVELENGSVLYAVPHKDSGSLNDIDKFFSKPPDYIDIQHEPEFMKNPNATILRKLDAAYVGDGFAINSGQFDGLSTLEFKEQITNWLEEQGLGKKAVNYKLRDWLFSRQRYWGEPFPILHTDNDQVVAISENELPLMLPEVDDYKPTGTGEPPLSNVDNWVNVTLADGTKAKRETNTMPQWAGSCWYYLRYLDPDNDQQGWDPEKEKYWMPVDLYIGGAEHAVLHLLYSRFWHKLLYDLGYVSTKEPFKKLINQGMILGEDGQKMSKSRGNVVNPDIVIADYGADSTRLYEMFMGPLEAMKPWSMHGVEGVHRFLQKLWRAVIDRDTGELDKAVQQVRADEATLRLLNRTIKKVGDDIESFGFNTAISAMMILVNHLSRETVRPKAVIEKIVLILAPFAPHIAEELWEKLGYSESLAYEPWPEYDKELIKEKEIELAVQVKGKIKDRIVVSADANEEQIQQKALSCEKVIAAMAGKEPRKIIVIKSRLVNIVT
ncbi:leucine--tRNA ligase [Planctomycetota bacterium]